MHTKRSVSLVEDTSNTHVSFLTVWSSFPPLNYPPQEITTSLPSSTHRILQHLQPRQLSSFEGEHFRHQHSIEQLLRIEEQGPGEDRTLNKGQLSALRDTMAMLREVGQDSSETAARVPHQTVEIDASAGDASSMQLPLEEEVEEEAVGVEEGTLQFFLRRLTEGKVDVSE